MKTGYSTIPHTQVPALLKGQMIVLDLARLQGQWGIVCSMPEIEFGDAVLLNQYLRAVQKRRAVLLGMLHLAHPPLDPHLPKAKALSMPLLADPSGCLARTLGLSGRSAPNRCQSFIFDQEGVIRYHLIHLFNWRGMSFLLETLKHCQDLYPQPTRQSSARLPHPLMLSGQAYIPTPCL
ncbi:MAG: hypothetical protein GKS05_00870 [Nitrospirales bacterium]|nr:hypothetical protein [Nitrospirales bacterium]